MKKRQFCEEIKKVIYTNEEEQTSYCKLDCIVNLFPEEDGIVPYALIDKLKSKYPSKGKNEKGEEVTQVGLNHQYGDVFEVHIETKATCQGGDVFDKKKGETIAYSKAQHKLYNLLYRVYADVDAFFVKYGRVSVTVELMFDRYREREEKFIESI